MRSPAKYSRSWVTARSKRASSEASPAPKPMRVRAPSSSTVRASGPTGEAMVVCMVGHNGRSGASREVGLRSVHGPRYLVEHVFASTFNTTPPRSLCMVDLTKRQQEIFDFIKRYSAKYGYPPTVRDIGKAVGLASSSTVHAHLANLEKLGLLRRDPSKPRAIELLDRVREDVGQRGRDGGRERARRAAPRPAARRPGRRRPADPGRGEHRGLRPGPVDRGRRGRRVRPARPRRVDEGRGHPRRRLRRRAPAGHRDRRRDHRRPRGRGGDRQALLPRVRPRAPAARERRHGADPLQGGPHPRARRRRVPERDR